MKVYESAESKNLFYPRKCTFDIYRPIALVARLTCTNDIYMSSLPSSLLSPFYHTSSKKRTDISFECCLRTSSDCIMAQAPSSSLVSVSPPATVPYIKCNFLDKDTGEATRFSGVREGSPLFRGFRSEQEARVEQ